MVQIQPNKDFLGAKESFHTEVSSLDTLLAYTEKDDTEDMFEVSIFAELFREMLEARFGRGILRTLETLEREDRRVGSALVALLLSLSACAIPMHSSLCVTTYLDLVCSSLPSETCMHSGEHRWLWFLLWGVSL